MTLLECCEPLFQAVCRWNRLGRNGGRVEETEARMEIKGIFEEMFRVARENGRLLEQLKKMELPLLFFVDSMIAESKLPMALKWHQNRLAFERNELAGDEKFFDLLEETLKEAGEEAGERLAVFYTCLGLGFGGMYVGQPEYLRKTMMTLLPRIRHLMDLDSSAKISPEAYAGVDKRNLVEPPSRRMAAVGMVFLACALSISAAYVFLFHQTSNGLTKSLGAILEQAGK